jgi:hypothetical protein
VAGEQIGDRRRAALVRDVDLTCSRVFGPQIT